MPQICDYEGSRYRQNFWENGERVYEDRAERIAIRSMLPPTGNRIIEVGAGFGRLADLYDRYEQIFLMDYAHTQLEEAQRYLGNRKNVVYVMADVYSLPFVPSAFDALVMVRVMHHLTDVPSALLELQRVVRGNGVAVVEHANKQNIKAIVRWILRRQSWNPFSPEPEEFVPLNFDFHPVWMRRQFKNAGFRLAAIRTVSHFRVPLLKKMFPPTWLAQLDGVAQQTGRWWQLSPSIFLKARPEKADVEKHSSSLLFQCPVCGNAPLVDKESGMWCKQCETMWEKRDGIYDFRTPHKTPPK